MALIDKMDKTIGRRTASSMVKRISAIAYQEKVDSMFLLLDAGHKEFPDDIQILTMLCYKATELDRKPDVAIGLMEKHLENNFNEDMSKRLTTAYMNKGDVEKGEATYRKMFEFIGYASNPYNKIAGYFFGRQQYDSAIVYFEKIHASSPYSPNAVGDIAYCYLQQNKKIRRWNTLRKGWHCMQGWTITVARSGRWKARRTYLPTSPGPTTTPASRKR